MTDGSGKSGDLRRAERLKAALRDNLQRRKAQMRARAKAEAPASAPKPAEPGKSAGTAGEIASPKPKG